jgi:hypothetical protein
MMAAASTKAMDLGVLLGTYAVVLALEVPLSIVVMRNRTQSRYLLLPLGLFAAAIVIPDAFAKVGLLFLSVVVMFVLAIAGRFRQSHAEDAAYLVAQGPTLWPARRRIQSRNLLIEGTVLMMGAIVLDAINGHRTILTVLMFPTGSLIIGLGLLRSHAVLVTYFGRARGRWLELVQVLALASAYVLVLAAEMSPDPDRRLSLRVLSTLPMLLHFVVVWLPLARTQERILLPGQPGPDSKRDRP